MMFRVRSLAWILGALAAVSTALAGAVVGCSSESTTVGVPVVDAGSDSTVVPEAGPLPDVDAGNILEFPSLVVSAFCQRTAQCCAQTDGGAIDESACIGRASGPKGLYGELEGRQVLDGGNIAYDPQKATECVQKILTLPCGDVSSATVQAVRDACFAAMTGTLQANAPCRAATECARDLYCSLQGGDAGVGRCQPIRAAGGPCGDLPSWQEAPQACSYRGSGSNGLTCQLFDFDAGNFRDAGDWRCAPAADVDASCFNNVDCTTRICDTTQARCASSYSFTLGGSQCRAYAPRDAGDGG